MAAPTRRTNPEMVRDCIEYRLKLISHANGNYTDGLVVRKDEDPRFISRNMDLQEYKEKKVLLQLRLGDKRRDGLQSAMYGNKRQMQRFELLGAVSHHKGLDDAGLTLDDVRERLIHDVTWELDADMTMTLAAVALGISPKPSCIDLEIDNVRVHPVQRFPHCTFVIEGHYQYEDRSPVP